MTLPTLRTDTIQIFALVHFVACSLRLMAGFMTHQHASTITDRTPHNFNELNKFLRLVKGVSLIVFCFTCYFLVQHDRTVIVSVLQFVLMMVNHGLAKRLNAKELKMPRVIDLDAASK